MTNVDQIQSLLQELGPLIDRIVGIDQEEDSIWYVEFDEGQLIELRFEPQQERLVFLAELGAPAEENKLETYRLLLMYNFLWQETGGIRMALDGPDGEVAMIFDLPAAELDLRTLQTVICNFADKASFWKQAIATGIRQESAPSLEGPASETMGAIRV